VRHAESGEMRGELKREGLSAEVMSAATRREIARRLPEFLQRQRWFGGKARAVRSAEIVDVVGISTETVMLVVSVTYADGGEEKYAIPVVRPLGRGVWDGEVMNSGDGGFADAIGDVGFRSTLLDCVKDEKTYHGEKGSLRGFRTKAFDDLYDESVRRETPRLIGGEQSNSSVIYRDKLILKFIRRMEKGENPDLEIGRFLSERTNYPHTAKVAGYLEYRSGEGGCVKQGILQEFVANQGDAWRHTQKQIGGRYRRAESGSDERLLKEMGLLGKRTAELHLALASDAKDAAFAPEEFTLEFQRSLQESFEELTRRTMGLLRGRVAEMDARWRMKCRELEAREDEILRRFQFLSEQRVAGKRIRIHGDYHLGQVLYTGTDFVIIDFEGEPARPLAERRKKQSALQDVAGMLRSFEYAAFAPLLMTSDAGGVEACRSAELWLAAEQWRRAAEERFLSEYFAACGGASFLPVQKEQRSALLKIYLLAKAVYELGYELNNRPSWVGLPVEGLLRLLAP
jgi:maltose alpha-D-glucosyltransferase / alpha-amylase